MAESLRSADAVYAALASSNLVSTAAQIAPRLRVQRRGAELVAEESQRDGATVPAMIAGVRMLRRGPAVTDAAGAAAAGASVSALGSCGSLVLPQLHRLGCLH